MLDDDEYDEEEFKALSKSSNIEWTQYLPILYTSIVVMGAMVIGRAVKKYKKMQIDKYTQFKEEPQQV